MKSTVRSLIAGVKALEHACDVDLLVFFYRHPRALLTSEQLVAFVGYSVPTIALSIDRLIAAGLLERSQSTATPHAGRLYLVVATGPKREWLDSLVEVARTRQGRKELHAMLKKDRSSGSRRDPKASRPHRWLRRIG